MDDLLLLREDAEHTQLPTEDRLAPARAQLVAAIRAEAAARTAAPARRRARRPLWPRWITAGLAGGLAVAGAIAVLTTQPRPASPPPPTMVPAAQILQHAAQASLRRPDVVPRADQFVYDKTTMKNGDVEEAWYSVDGTRDGFIRSSETTLPGCQHGEAQVYVGDKPLPGKFEPCEPDPAYDPRIPADPEAMLVYLHQRNSNEDPESTANSIAKYVWETSTMKYLRPAQRAALFQAAATIPGLHTAQTTDAMGRPGIGISWTFGGSPAQTLVFDPRTYEFLGTPDSTEDFRIVDRVGNRS